MTDIDRLIGELASGVKPVTRPMRPYRLALQWLLLAALYVGVMVCVSGTRIDLLTRFDDPLFAEEIALLVLMIASSVTSAALYTVPDAMQKETLALSPFILLALFIALLTYALHQQSPMVPLPDHRLFCTLCITLYAVPPAMMLFLRMRHGATTHPARAGAIATIGAFSMGALVLRFVEKTDSMYHLVTMHYLPMFVVAALGVALGKTLFRW